MNNIETKTKVVGNVGASDDAQGFKSEIVNTFEQYANEGINLNTDLYAILASPTQAQNFNDVVMESVTGSPALSAAETTSDPFYGNYAERLAQLAENSEKDIVRESVMTGYAPIVSYAPFFLKKQWISCVWKDVLLTEVPNNPVINYQFQKRYIKDMQGNRYEIPDIYYDKETMRKLLAESTGVALKEDPIDISIARNLNLVDPTKNADPSKYYLEDGFVARDLANALTPDMIIFQVILKDAATNTEYTVPTNIRVDITTHNFVGGRVSYTVKDTDGNPVKTLEDEIVGNVDFDTSSITVVSVNGVATKFCLRGKTANRFNHRGLDVERRVEQLQYIMPESGPRLNSAVTIEEAADAIALGNIDMFADNCDMMGNVLANLEDIEIKSFMDTSYKAQKDAKEAGLVGAHNFPQGYSEGFIEEASFSALPFGGYGNNITQWMTDVKEYFDRLIEQLKYKLNTSQCIITAVCHPSLVRYIKADIKWVFSDQTDISGMKLQYDFGITNQNGDRVHIISSRYMHPDEGVRFVVIPTTSDLITFKHLKYSVTVDRGYRHPLEPLVPNMMATQRTLTFEVLPVQGKLEITGRDMSSPTNVGSSNVVLINPDGTPRE
jgi:hypothetical protein